MLRRCRLLLLVGVMLCVFALGVVGANEHVLYLDRSSGTTANDNPIGNTNEFAGNGFLASSDACISMIGIRLKGTTGTPTADMRACLNSGITSNTDSALDNTTCINGVFGSQPASNITASSNDWNNFSFSECVPITGGDYYGILFYEATDDGTTNYYTYTMDQTVYTDGNDFYSNDNGATWLTVGTTDYDVHFRLYNSTNETSLSLPATPAPTFVDPSPPNGTVNDTSVVFNVTCDAGLTHYYWFSNFSEPTTLVSENNASGLYYANPTVSDTYYARAACYNGTSGVFSLNVTRNWVYDTLSPNILLSAGNEFDENNFSRRPIFDDNLYLEFLFTDNNALFQAQINVSAPNGSSMVVETPGISGTSYNYTSNIDTSDWPSAVYNIDILVSDSHTDEEIGVYDVRSRSNGLRFRTLEGNDIQVYSNGVSSAQAFKKKDRYEFEFDFDAKGNKQRVFNVVADKKIHYLENSSYKAHFVVWNNDGGNWIDFEGTPGTPIVHKVSDLHYRVTFANMNANPRFRSIGGLNVANVSYQYWVGKYEYTRYNTATLEPLNFKLITSYDPSVLSDLTAHFYMNGTNLTGVRTITNSTSRVFEIDFTAPAVATQQDIPFSWYTLESYNGSVTSNTNITDAFTVSPWGIDNCSSEPSVSFIFKGIDENDESDITYSYDATWTVWRTNVSNNLNFSFSYDGGTNYSICMSEGVGPLRASAIINYDKSGYAQRSYFYSNVTVDNSTDLVDLYLLPEDNSSNIVIQVYDRFGDPLKGVFVKALRYYPGNNNFKTVEISRTDEQGQALLHLVGFNAWYQFIIQDGSETLLVTSTNKVIVTPINIYINTQVSALTEFEGLQNAVGTITYNNATGVFSMFYNDPDNVGYEVCLDVWKVTAKQDINVCHTCSTSQSGTLLCSIDNADGSLYKATGYLDTAQDTSVYTLKEFLVDLRPTLVESFKGIGNYATFMLVGTTFFIGIFNPAVAVVFVIVTLGVSLVLGFMTLGSQTLVIFTTLAIISIVIAAKVRA